MKLEAYHMKKIVLTDVDGNVFTGTSYFCDKEDYDADEDGLEMLVDGNFIIFYQSDIKSIEAIQHFYKLLAMDKYKKQREFVINRKSDLNLLSVQKDMYIYELR